MNESAARPRYTAPRYTAQHWGIYEIERDADGKPRLVGMRSDPDPSPIGLHQLDDAVTRLRVRRPAVRRSWLEHGPGAATERRGRDDFVEVDWPVALSLVATELQRVRSQHGNTAIFGGSYGWSSAGRFHHAQSQVHRFLNTLGGYVRHVDSYSLGAGRVITPHVVAHMDELQASHTSWDVLAGHTGLFVSFGGVPLKNTQISSGGAGDHRVRAGLRAMAQAGARFINISPVRDNLETGGEVEWIPIRPNTDTALMLALAYVLETEGLADAAFLERYCTGYDRFRPYLLGAADGQAKTPDWAAAITGVPAGRIVALARELAATRSIVNVAWGLAARHAWRAAVLDGDHPGLHARPDRAARRRLRGRLRGDERSGQRASALRRPGAATGQQRRARLHSGRADQRHAAASGRDLHL